MKSAEHNDANQIIGAWMRTTNLHTDLHDDDYKTLLAMVQKGIDDAYNSAIHDAASTTNSGMDNYQRIMGLLRK